jgi:outer membrane protein
VKLKSFTGIIIIGMFIFGMVNLTYAQLNIRYINSNRILAEYPEAKDIQGKLDEIRSGYEDEYNKMLKDYEALIKEIESQSLLLSPEKKAEKEKQAQEMGVNIEKFRYDKLGPQGEFFKKNQELTQPLYDKIDQIIQKIGDADGYDFILDVVQGVVLFAKPEFDITDKILDELNKSK